MMYPLALLAVFALALTGCGSESVAPVVVQHEWSERAVVVALEMRVAQLEETVAGLGRVVSNSPLDLSTEINLAALRDCLRDLEAGRSSFSCGRVVR